MAASLDTATTDPLTAAAAASGAARLPSLVGLTRTGLSQALAGMGVPVPQRLRALLNAEKQKGAS